ARHRDPLRLLRPADQPLEHRGHDEDGPGRQPAHAAAAAPHLHLPEAHARNHRHAADADGGAAVFLMANHGKASRWSALTSTRCSMSARSQTSGLGSTRSTAGHSLAGRMRSRLDRRGSVLLIVMITLLFATFALVAFMDKATNDLLVEQRDVEARRLRQEAYSALEATLAVLQDFSLVDNGLHSPAEGWGDPLGFMAYTPGEDRTVDVAFEDESGKISLPHVNPLILTNLFKTWGIQDTDAATLTDAMMGWMKPNYVYSTGLDTDYDQGTVPYQEPWRPLRSFEELAAIDKVRETFYDADGRPNDLWRRFADSVSLLDFKQPNMNGAKPDTLAAVALFDQTGQQNVTDYLKGTGQYQVQGPGYFTNLQDVGNIAASQGDTSAFSTTISALRIYITVHEGQSQFRLSAVIAPPGGATTVQTTATSTRTQASAQTTKNPNSQANATKSNSATNVQNGGNTGNNRNLQYPFTLLEIRENDQIPPPPPPPPPTQPCGFRSNSPPGRDPPPAMSI